MIEHLSYIQNTVDRMSHNSFLIKGWTITFMSLLFILAINNSNYWFLILALFTLICFWGLDAYYLRQERLFRKLYDFVRKDKIKEPFTMNTNPLKRYVHSWSLTLFSPTIVLIYFPIMFLNILLQLLIINGVL